MLSRTVLSVAVALALTNPTFAGSYFLGIVSQVGKDSLTIVGDADLGTRTFKMSDGQLKGDPKGELGFPNKFAEVRVGDRVDIGYFRPDGKTELCTDILIRRDCLVGVVTALTKTTITVKSKDVSLTYKLDEESISGHLRERTLSPYKNRAGDVGKGDRVEIQFKKREKELICTGIRLIREN